MNTEIAYRVAWVPDPGSPLSIATSSLFGDDVVIDDQPDPRHISLARRAAVGAGAPPAPAAILSDRLFVSGSAPWMLETALHRLAERHAQFRAPRLICATEAGRVVLRPAEPSAALSLFLDRLALVMDRTTEIARRREVLSNRDTQTERTRHGRAGVAPFRIVLTGRLEGAALLDHHRRLSRMLARHLTVPYAIASLSLLVDRGDGPATARYCATGMAMCQRIHLSGSAERLDASGALPADGRSSLTMLGDA
ncbi:MAG: DUF1045 domain-containing protein [Pseudomonadota bacterium]